MTRPPINPAFDENEMRDHEVRIWNKPLTDSALSDLDSLNDDERDRAARFMNERARNEFIQARAFLRRLLESCGAGPAKQIAFSHSANGKPELARAETPLQFNVSHTRELAVFAVTRSHPVGVDVEWLGATREAEGIVASRFAPEEQAEFAGLPEAMKQRGFLQGWTRKEAFIKALGRGLGYDLASFAITLVGPARLLRVAADAGHVSDWTLADLPLSPNHCAAVAVRGANIRIKDEGGRMKDQ